MSTPHADPEPLSVQCAVITVSDTRGQTTDKSGQLMRSRLTESGHAITHYQIVKDQPEQIAALVTSLASRSDVQAVLLNGGTGIAARDTTFDAIAPLLDKELPGFGELFRHLSYAEIGSRAIASRAIAGIHHQTLIFSVPGSTKAVSLALEKLILPELQHLTRLLQPGS
ncbi:molybdenum cofactor biosynthesis protein MoaB [cf. Phormidesmis sp. LEGE 11477]|nr:molybdenum cofactor biosynthesis protein MoaB [cf. Phormidesmis sp. LEGE 11477]